MNHPVVWFEVLGEDPAKLQTFYRSLFDWPLEGDQYKMLGEVPTGIPGGVGPRASRPEQPGVTFYVSTTDLEATLERTTALGGRVTLGPTQLPDGPLMALIEDPEGHCIGLLGAEAQAR